MSDLGDKIRALAKEDIGPRTNGWNRALDRAAALADEHEATIAAVYEAAADTAIQHISKIQVNEPLWHEGQDWAADRISQAIRALAATDPDGSAALERIKAEARREGMREAAGICAAIYATQRKKSMIGQANGADKCRAAILSAAGEDNANG